jgi:hypothetical protein
VEPLLTLDQQSQLWTAGYALLVLLVVGCAFTIPGRHRGRAGRSVARSKPESGCCTGSRWRRFRPA